MQLRVLVYSSNEHCSYKLYYVYVYLIPIITYSMQVVVLSTEAARAKIVLRIIEFNCFAL